MQLCVQKDKNRKSLFQYLKGVFAGAEGKRLNPDCSDYTLLEGVYDVNSLTSAFLFL